ncbi:hypothetical protein BBD42_19535 [Paenibacillus sp. BIHB 4019]|uniref:Uncharacterized protein n=1 Tax=Paenibacillus sp. BIHB 4019 TaxID=1870819 RepID=A0A1B2DL18_9BACL|nr:hypothetical protein [Paenibacillus sp. BIHB 4019]ANY68418.1 hypothetical protein BBD42_19535 [Paenibacillus sp. BIHB 4019]
MGKNSLFILLLILTICLGACSSEVKPSGEASAVASGTAETPTASNTPADGGAHAGAATMEPIAEPTAAPLLDTAVLGKSAFGFADEAGKQLLASPTEGGSEQWASFNLAVGHNGQLLKIKYNNEQKATEADNGRQTAQNFANQQGQLFEVVEGKAVPNETYFLTDDQSVKPEMLLSIADKRSGQAADDVKAAIAKSKNRSVEKLWPLEEIGTAGNALYLVQFERQGKDMLASLALQTADGFIFQDYPAEFNESSTWRVDDGGEVMPEMFSFLFAAKTAEGIVLGVKWMGAEGENVSFLSEHDGKLAELDISYGRYMSPV